MRILFHMLPEPGHLNPTFPVARALANRGHEVIYTSVLDLQPAIEARGFQCVPLHRDIVREGRLTEIEQLVAPEERELAWNQIRDRIHDEYFDGTIEDTVRAIDPAVVAADVITLSPLQFVAHRLGIPWLQISTSLSQRNDELPPISSSLLPRARPMELAAARWESSCLRLVTFGRAPLASAIASTFDAYSVRFGYPSDQISVESVFNPALTLAPELVLCPSALDFPRTTACRQQHIASPVDLERAEHVPTELEAFADRNRTLVYASLGTQSGRYPEAVRFFRSVVDALRGHPEWGAVISTGPRFLDNPAFADLPPNVMILRSVPQLWLLRRAGVFVTHAGLGGIRESVALQVPMITVPQLFDQLGNAARVASNGIGVRLSAEAITSSTLATAIEQMLRDRSAYAGRLHDLHARCLAEQTEHGGLDLFEQTAVSAKKPAKRATSDRAASSEPRGSLRGWMFVGSSGPVVLRAGTVLHDDRLGRVGVGTYGFTSCQQLGDALSRAGGAFLARVEVAGELERDGRFVAGRTVRCRWTLDVDEALYDYAAWCADQVFESERTAAPETIIGLTDQIREFHALRRGGARVKLLVDRFREAFDQATPLWDRGYGIAATAIAPGSHDAARGSRRLALLHLARRSVVASAGTSEAADQFEQAYRQLSERFSIELQRFVGELVRASTVLGYDE